MGKSKNECEYDFGDEDRARQLIKRLDLKTIIAIKQKMNLDLQQIYNR